MCSPRSPLTSWPGLTRPPRGHTAHASNKRPWMAGSGAGHDEEGLRATFLRHSRRALRTVTRVAPSAMTTPRTSPHPRNHTCIPGRSASARRAGGLPVSSGARRSMRRSKQGPSPRLASWPLLAGKVPDSRALRGFREGTIGPVVDVAGAPCAVTASASAMTTLGRRRGSPRSQKRGGLEGLPPGGVRGPALARAATTPGAGEHRHG